MNSYPPAGYQPVPPVLPAPDPVKQENRRRRKEYNTLGIALFTQMGISLAFTFAIVFGVIFVQVFTTVSQTGSMPDLSNPMLFMPPWLIPVATLVAMTAANLVPSFAFSNRLGLDVKDMFRPKATTVWVVLGGTAACFAVNYCASFFMQFVNWLLSQAGAQMTTPDLSLNYDAGGNAAMVLYTVIIAPITEEFLCRGLLLRTLQRTGRTFAIVGSSLLFAMLHGNFIQGVPTFLIGLVLGYIAVRCGSLIPGILIHFINNGFVMLIGSIGESVSWLPVFEYVFFAVCLAAAIVVVWRERSRFHLLSERKAPKGSWGLLLTSWAVLVNLVFYLGIALTFFRPV